MTKQDVIDLGWLTITAPRDAALEIMAMRVHRQTLWMALLLAAMISTILFSLRLKVLGDVGELPKYAYMPFAVFVLLAGLLAMLVYAQFWIGKALGGWGDFSDLLGLMAWLQLLQAIAQGVTLVLMLALPPLAGLFSLAAGLWGAWINANFIAAALHLKSPLHGLGVMVLGAAGVAVGVVIFLTIISLIALGVPANV